MYRVICIVLMIAFASAQSKLYYEEKERDTIDDETEALMKLLTLNAVPERYRPLQYFQKIGMDIGGRVKSFSWSKCGGSLAEITDMAVTPDPIALPGTLHIQAKGNISATSIDSPLPATLEIKKKAAGVWIKIPCVGDFGSCSYDDFCEILDSVGDCPDPIVSSGLGCNCPFKKGTYNVPSVDIDIPYGFPSGDYNITGTLHYQNQLAACLNLMLTIS
ncbi:hypothetical protein FSP39_018706 [Pinctada imbricata]|uniref:MD-2-related lipid-recognition domain-containing protein n=1 Tax=Pinctada imbricata TaxID=66713 RepID=A0AA88YNB2_PINIB|nr:hypothetical protein FSP39_018706 [Pinctada imbricata]